MFWSKKESEKKLPDLPPYQPVGTNKPQIYESSGLHESDDEDLETPEKHYLPSFPDSPVKKGFSQSAIKDAVSTDEIPEENADPIVEKKFKTIEISDFSDASPSIASSGGMSPSIASRRPPIDSFPMEKKVPEPKIPSFEKPNFEKPSFEKSQTPSFKTQVDKGQKSRDIFVKIDKFHSARRSLEIIKDKVSEIDDLLKRIRETKLREEQELASWEKEINSVKAKIQDVNDNIFERLE